MNTKWIIKNVNANTAKMAQDLKISPIFATVLANRNLLTKNKVISYLSTDQNFLNNPLLMKSLEEAILIILDIIKNQGLICIYGDYDVDGVCSTTILYKGLKKLGANIMFYIPDRETEGYGLNISTIEKLQSTEDIDLFLTCDNGITSIEEVKFIKDSNTKIVIIDHHEPLFHYQENEKFELIPIADAIINPKQSQCEYPFKPLCAGAICFKFIQALYDYLELDDDFNQDLEEYLVFASIATVCDIVDLIDENRIITQLGLDLINKNKNINLGLSYLLKAYSITDNNISEYDYGFKIGPCINASGRLKQASIAVSLFTTHDHKEAERIANYLFDLNTKRKDLTKFAVESVFEQVQNSNIKNQKVIVIYNKEIHESIAGIVAGRIKDILYKPTFVITKAHSGLKGSGRSIPSYNMFDEMAKCSHLFERFGGHKMAAGLSLDESNLQQFTELINKNCMLCDDDFKELIIIDKSIDFRDINIFLAKELAKMKPFGKDNKEAIFATKAVCIQNFKLVGKNKDIIQFTFQDSLNQTLKAISFSGYSNFIDLLSQKYSENQIQDFLLDSTKNIDLLLDIVYSIDINVFRNTESVQLNIKALRLN